MKNLILFLIIIPSIIILEKTDSTFQSKSTNINKSKLIDEDLFNREIHNAAMDAAKEMGINPDSTYIPHRDKFKK